MKSSRIVRGVVIGLLGFTLATGGAMVGRSLWVTAPNVTSGPKRASAATVSLPAHLLPFLSKPFPSRLQEKFPGGWEEMFPQVFSYHFQVHMLFSSALVTYVEYNAEYPANLEKLCERPYRPADCNALKNPFTGRPLLETSRGVDGWIGYEPPKDRKAIDQPAYLVVGTPDIEKETAEYREVKIPLGGDWRRDFVPRDRSIGDAALTALSVLTALGTALVSYHAFFGGPPKDFKELESFMPLVGALRNDYRGDLAKLERFVDLSGSPDEVKALDEVERQATQIRGTPGDFVLFVTRKSGRAFVFGGDGRPVHIVADELRARQLKELEGMNRVRVRTGQP